VSKPCCPVCWEVLKILRGESQELQVDAFHQTLTQVELPDGLPLDVVEGVTTRFEIILRDQITTMMSQKKKQHIHHPSDQSGGGFSSDEDDELVDSDFDSDADDGHALNFE
jgi:hypothetical protein